MAYLLLVIATIAAPTNMIADASSVTMPASHANSAMTNVPLRTSGCGWTAPWKKPTIAVGRHARPRRETSGAASRRAHPSHHCWPTCFSLTAGSRYGLGPNVYPRKSNSPSGTLQFRVFSSFTVSFKEGHGESRSDHSGLRRDPVSLRDNGSFPDLRPILQTEEARARQNENSLELAIARIERRIAHGEDRTARAFETIAHMLDRPPGVKLCSQKPDARPSRTQYRASRRNPSKPTWLMPSQAQRRRRRPHGDARTDRRNGANS